MNYEIRLCIKLVRVKLKFVICCFFTERISDVADLNNKVTAEENRIADLRLINEPVAIRSPYVIIVQFDERTTAKSNWISSYAGRGSDFEILLIMAIPILISQLINILFKKYLYPQLKFRENIEEQVLIPLSYLQQTKDEERVKREKRNGLEWLGTKFVIRAGDSNMVDDEVIAKNTATDAFKRMKN